MDLLDDDSTTQCCQCRNHLTDPVLLSCLHSCCRQCLSESATTKNDDATCGTCNATVTAAARDDNFLMVALQRFNSLVKDPEWPVCFSCEASTRADEDAGIWCCPCQAFFCGDCSLLHGKFNKLHVTTSLKKLQSSGMECLLPQRMCRQHGKSLDYLCSNCDAPKCMECEQTCLDSRHSVRLIGSSVGSKRVEEVKSKISSLGQALKSRSGAWHRQRNLAEDLRQSRKRCLALLQRNKKFLLDAIDRAVEEAEKVVHNYHDRLDEEAVTLVNVAVQLDDGARHAVRYSKRLVGCNDDVTLLAQQKIVLTRMQSLIEEMQKLQAGTARLKFVAIDCALPCSVDDAVRKFVGEPRLATEASGSFAREEEQAHELPAGEQSESIIMQLQSSSSGKLQAVATFHGRKAKSHTTFEYCDVAALSTGHVVALTNEGRVEEHHTPGSHCHSSWVPTSSSTRGGRAVAMALLDDSRMALAFDQQPRVLLFRPQYPPSQLAWLEEDLCLSDLELQPQKMAASRELVAVTGLPVAVHVEPASAAEAERSAAAVMTAAATRGDRLAVLSAVDGRTLLSVQLEYTAASVALSGACASRVIVASSTELESGGNGLRCHVMDCYDVGRGCKLWRSEWTACRVCAAPAVHALYVARLSAAGRAEVVAVGPGDGLLLKSVWQSHTLVWQGHTRVRPMLALSSGDPTFLVMLEADGTVTVLKQTGLTYLLHKCY